MDIRKKSALYSIGVDYPESFRIIYLAIDSAMHLQYKRNHSNLKYLYSSKSSFLENRLFKVRHFCPLLLGVGFILERWKTNDGVV